jgi:hypothetical protein
MEKSSETAALAGIRRLIERKAIAKRREAALLNQIPIEEMAETHALSESDQERLKEYLAAQKRLTDLIPKEAAGQPVKSEYEDAWKEEWAEAWNRVLRPSLLSHPVVQERAATLRLFDGPAAFRRKKNNADVQSLSGRVTSAGHDFISNWLEEYAAPLLRDGLGPERVRRRLRQIAKQIQSPEAEPLRNRLLQAMATPQGFHKRLVSLGLIEADKR